MKVLMVGVDAGRKGGMRTVVENYLEDAAFCSAAGLCYIPTATDGSVLRKILYFAGAYLRVVRELGKGYDVMHMHLSERGSLYRKGILQRLAKRKGCKSVIHMHGGYFEDWYNSCGKSRQKHIRGVLCGADHILLLGRHMEPFVAGLTGTPGRISILHNAVPVPADNPYNADGRYILYLAWMREEKGVLDLLRALALIREELPPGYRLALCGEDEEGLVPGEVERLGLGDLVELRGWVGAEEKEGLLRDCAVHVLPSHREVLPMAVLETMARGIPNISTRVAAIPEAVADGEDGFLVEPRDVPALTRALRALLSDKRLRERFSRHGWNKMREEFSIESHSGKLLSVYEEVLAGPSNLSGQDGRAPKGRYV